MLQHPTLDKLVQLRLPGMYKALREQMENPDTGSLSFEERFALMLDREEMWRANSRLAARLGRAKLRLQASMEDVDYRQPRGLDKAKILSLASCTWLRNHDNCLITGPTGCGKSYLACALGHQACREGFSVLYLRVPKLFQDLALAKADGRYGKILVNFSHYDLLILDDWGTAVLTDEQRKDLFEILEDRYDRRSTLVTSQVPPNHWHEIIGDPTLADAILDRLIHNAHSILLKGESMRKQRKAQDNNEK
jgi:DNA replication protein DnaC